MWLRLLFCFLGMLPVIAQAQDRSNVQLWVDYLADLQAGKNLYETEFSFQTILSNTHKWYSINATPAYERNLNKHVDLISGLGLSYTSQTDTTNTFESRIMLGARFYLTPDRRVQTRITTRFERRYQTFTSDVDWEVSNRSRIRFEAVIPINKPSYSEDKLWYGITDLEYFYVFDRDLEERFANRSRTRFGIGYRNTYNLRYEIIYTLQRSRNQLSDGFITSDHIIRLRIKHYLM